MFGGWTLGILLAKKDSAFYIAFVLAFVTLPAAVPGAITVGPFALRPYVPFLIVATGLALIRYRAPRQANAASLAATALLLSGVALGLLHGHTPQEVFADVRMFGYFVVAVILGTHIWGTPIIDGCLKALPWMLWISAALTLVGSSTGLPLNGRHESTDLSNPLANDGAARIITPITYLAIFVLCACLALAISNRKKLRETAYLWTPCLVLMAIAFSRNNLLSLIAAGLFALVATRSSRGTLFATVSATAVGIAVTLIHLAGPQIASLPGGTYINLQVAGYTERVVNGLSRDAVQADYGIQYRQEENGYARAAISSSPVIGHGFGYAYKPAFGAANGDAFFAVAGRYYAHNFYYWITIKTGLLGLAAFLFVSLRPVLMALGRRSTATLALGAGSVGLLASSFVAPMPIGNPTSVLIGACLGMLAAAVTETPTPAKRSPRTGMPPVDLTHGRQTSVIQAEGSWA